MEMLIPHILAKTIACDVGDKASACVCPPSTAAEVAAAADADPIGGTRRTGPCLAS